MVNKRLATSVSGAKPPDQFDFVNQTFDQDNLFSNVSLTYQSGTKAMCKSPQAPARAAGPGIIKSDKEHIESKKRGDSALKQIRNSIKSSIGSIFSKSSSIKIAPVVQLSAEPAISKK